MAINENLPEKCFTVQPVTGEVVMIKRGEPGYFEIELPFPVPPEGGVWTAEQFNAALGVTPAQVRAMEAGSMFGWHVPLADPAKFE